MEQEHDDYDGTFEERLRKEEIMCLDMKAQNIEIRTQKYYHYITYLVTC